MEHPQGLGFAGYASGGRCGGGAKEAMYETTNCTTSLLPESAPRYLMGVGSPEDLVECVAHGVDMFDCVLPTRNGRNAQAFTANGPVKLRNEQYKTADQPIEDGCDCPACTHFSRGYIRHLFVGDAMLGPIPASIHNIRFHSQIMGRIR